MSFTAWARCPSYQEEPDCFKQVARFKYWLDAIDYAASVSKGGSPVVLVTDHRFNLITKPSFYVDGTTVYDREFVA